MHKIDKKSFIGSFDSYQAIPYTSKNIISFIGRSNAGKSSLINSLFGTSVAKCSQTPGKTQKINLFHFDKKTIFADLPGYGFAKQSKEHRKSWIRTSTDFLVNNKKIALIVIVADARRQDLSDMDKEFLLWTLQDTSIPVAIILTKVDKIKKNEAESTIENIRSSVPNNCITVIGCSNKTFHNIKGIVEFLKNFSLQR